MSNHFSHYCPCCYGAIYEEDCTGESGLYGSYGILDLCEPCWLKEERLTDEAGTNAMPERLAFYRENIRKFNR